LAVFERLAPAKVNLFLHVGPLGADGYHPICSLMTFADLGDVIGLENSDRNELVITGPFADGLSSGADNLVARAREAVLEAFETPAGAYRVTLDKQLPIAAGLGGGSSDAAATLVLMAESLGLVGVDAALDEEAWGAIGEIALSLGSDTPACVVGEPRLASGRGEVLDFPPIFPDLDAVLVNPAVLSDTAAVYRAYDSFRDAGGDDAPAFPAPLESAEATAAWLARQRNDLEGPAISLAPQIAVALRLLKDQPETLLARMSGSGATCFALCRNRQDAQDLALRIGSSHGRWWVRACRLKGFYA